MWVTPLTLNTSSAGARKPWPLSGSLSRKAISVLGWHSEFLMITLNVTSGGVPFQEAVFETQNLVGYR